jgi:hypothetical protein
VKVTCQGQAARRGRSEKLLPGRLPPAGRGFHYVRALSCGYPDLMATSDGPPCTMPMFSVAEEAQPLGAMVARVIASLDYLGQPLSVDEKDAIAAAIQNPDDAEAVRAIQSVIDPHCLALIHINSDSRVEVAPEVDRAAILFEGGWSVFLLKVHNEAGVTAQLRGMSPNGASTFDSPKEEIHDRWMELEMFNAQPLSKELSGLTVEYRILQIYSRDAGQREAKLLFDVGQGTQDIGFRNELDLLFTCRKAETIALQIHDENDQPCTAAFEIRE